MATISVGSTVRYVGAQRDELSGVEGVVTDIDPVARKAHVFWAQHIRAIKEGRKREAPSWEPADDLKPIRAFTKGFREGELWNARKKMGGDPTPNQNMRGNMGRGIYHGTGVSKDDFVIHEHRNAYWPDLVFAGGTHIKIGPTRGFPTVRDAVEGHGGIRETAENRGIRRYEIYQQQGDELVWVGDQNSAEFTSNARQMDDSRGYPMDLHGHVTGDTGPMAARKYHQFLMRHYGVDSRTAGKMTERVRNQVEDWRERNGLPAPSSALVRGYIQDLVSGGPRGPRRNPGHPPAPRAPRPGRHVMRTRGTQPAAVLPRLRRMIDESESDFDPERRYPRETKPHHFAVNSSEVSREEIVEGAARAFFVSAWADGAEEAGHGNLLSGAQLEDIAPETPQEILDGAEQFVSSVQQLNRADIEVLYLEAANAPGSHEREPTPHDFGFSLAMQALGTGVSWYDDHPEPAKGALAHPDVEVGVGVSEDDPGEASVDYWELSERFAKLRR